MFGRESNQWRAENSAIRLRNRQLHRPPFTNEEKNSETAKLKDRAGCCVRRVPHSAIGCL